MSFGRYTGAPRINLGSQLGTSEIVAILRNSIRDGSIPIVDQIIATGNDRLDTLASVVYNDAKYWWVLAAASNIGWGLQVPVGTVVKIVDLADVEKLLG